ncbi:MAG: DUF1848 domain-containing protein [Caldicoprobacterales bacterium]
MVLSVSRRTDIPAFYSQWFINRLKEGYVFIKNPMNSKQISKININPQVVDCIVFWTKNPRPLIKSLDEIDSMGYHYYFQFTITPYDNTIERALPDKSKIIETFIALSKKIGKEKLVWRYDPIILNPSLTIDYHVEAFERMVSQLYQYTNECIISFVDLYSKTEKNMGKDSIRQIREDEMHIIAKEFSRIAHKRGIKILTCSEKIDLDQYGIEHASCIDKEKIDNIIGCSLSHKIKKDGQRPNCGCIECIDIGAYNTCKHNCLYCYASFSTEQVIKNNKLHNPKSAILIGDSGEITNYSERKVISFRDNQLRFI